MTFIYVLEILVLVVSVVSGFTITIKYLVRFQRKIDRLLILTGTNAERIKDLENFLEKTSNFRAKRSLEESSPPELNTDFI